MKSLARASGCAGSRCGGSLGIVRDQGAELAEAFNPADLMHLVADGRQQAAHGFVIDAGSAQCAKHLLDNPAAAAGSKFDQTGNFTCGRADLSAGRGGKRAGPGKGAESDSR